MASRDFSFLSLRPPMVAYQANGLPVQGNTVLITSSNGAATFSNSINISSVSVSTLNSNYISSNTISTNTIDVDFLNAAVISTFSHLTSTITASAINASSISTGYLNSNYISANIISSNTIDVNFLNAGSISTFNHLTSTITASTIITGYLQAINANISTLNSSTVNANTMSTLSLSVRNRINLLSTATGFPPLLATWDSDSLYLNGYPVATDATVSTVSSVFWQDGSTSSGIIVTRHNGVTPFNYLVGVGYSNTEPINATFDVKYTGTTPGNVFNVSSNNNRLTMDSNGVVFITNTLSTNSINVDSGLIQTSNNTMMTLSTINYLNINSGGVRLYDPGDDAGAILSLFNDKASITTSQNYDGMYLEASGNKPIRLCSTISGGPPFNFYGVFGPDNNTLISTIINGDLQATGYLSTNTINMNNGILNMNTGANNGQITGLSTINGSPWSPNDDALWSGSVGGNIYNDNSGFVGIGTNNPQALLDINYNIQIFSTAGTYNIVIPNDATNMFFEIIGSGGASSGGPGGNGGYIKGLINVTTFKGHTITIVAGQTGNPTTPSNASYIYKQTTGPLFVMAGAGGCGTGEQGTQTGGSGGGGYFSQIDSSQNWVAIGGNGQSGNAGQGGQTTGGGTPGGSGRPIPENYQQALGGNNLDTGAPGGSGYTGGGSGGSAGGGSSYYNSDYTTIELSFAGNNIPSSILPNYGRNSTSGYVSIYFGTTIAGIITNGNVGIGTNNPQYTLDVNGSINAVAYLSTNTIQMNSGDIIFSNQININPYPADLNNSNINIGTSYNPLITLGSTGSTKIHTLNGNLNISGVIISPNNLLYNSIITISGTYILTDLINNPLVTGYVRVNIVVIGGGGGGNGAFIAGGTTYYGGGGGGSGQEVSQTYYIPVSNNQVIPTLNTQFNITIGTGGQGGGANKSSPAVNGTITKITDNINIINMSASGGQGADTGLLNNPDFGGNGYYGGGVGGGDDTQLGDPGLSLVYYPLRSGNVRNNGGSGININGGNGDGPSGTGGTGGNDGLFFGGGGGGSSSLGTGGNGGNGANLNGGNGTNGSGGGGGASDNSGQYGSGGNGGNGCVQIQIFSI